MIASKMRVSWAQLSPLQLGPQRSLLGTCALRFAERLSHRVFPQAVSAI